MRAILSLWCALALVEVARTAGVAQALDEPLGLPQLAPTGIWWGAWLLLAPLAGALVDRTVLQSGRWRRSIALQLCAAPAFLATQAVVAAVGLRALHTHPLAIGTIVMGLLRTQSVRAFGVFVAGLGAAHCTRAYNAWRSQARLALVAERRAARLEAAALQSRFEALRRGVDPARTRASLERIREAAAAGEAGVAERRITDLGDALRSALSRHRNGDPPEGSEVGEIVGSEPIPTSGHPAISTEAAASEMRSALLPLVFLWAVFATFDLGVDVVVAVTSGNVILLPLRDPAIWWLVWIALTPAVVLAARALRPERVGWVGTVAGQIAVGAILVALQAAVAIAAFKVVSGVLGTTAFVPDYLAHLRAFALSSLGVYLSASATCYVVTYRARERASARAAATAGARAARMEALLAHSRLAALRRDLRPHFLYNALQSAAGLVRAGQGLRAAELVGALKELLDDSLARDGQALVPLADEISIVRRYLAIETVRFEDRMRVEWAVDPVVDRALVLPLVLQPLVENAVRHGVARRVDTVTIRISAAADGDALELAVADDGPGPPPNPGGDGIGLGNTRARLRHVYGDAASLTLSAAPGGGAEARMRLPLRGVRGGLDAA